MVYFVFTYFCGSVYNENPYGKLKMALASVLIIQDMALERFMEQGSLDVKAMADAAHTYSREVEHSDENRMLPGGAPYKGSPVWIEGFSGGHAVRD